MDIENEADSIKSATEPNKSKDLSFFHTLIRKVKNYLIAFCEHGSMHGLNFLAMPQLSLFEKCFWFGLFGVFFGFSIYVGLLAIDRFETKSTVVSLERDYHYWNTTFPGITVCPFKRLNPKLYDEFAKKHGIDGLEKIELFSFLESLANATYKNFENILYYESTDHVLEKFQFKPENYSEMIYDLAVKNVFDGYDNRSYSEFVQDGQLNFCQSGETIMVTRQVLTEFGLCYMTNTFLSDKYSANYFVKGQLTPRNETWWHQTKKCLHSSFFHADSSYHLRNCGKNSPYTIFFHSAFEVMNIEQSLGYATIPFHISAEAMEITVNDNFEQETRISQRKCRFPHESNLKHFPIYTKNLCLQECRLNLVFKICKCIPHFYPNRLLKPKPVCHYKTLISCVGTNAEYFLKLYPPKAKNQTNKMKLPKVECACLQNCRDAIVNVIESYAVEGSLGIVEANMVEVSLIKLPRKRLVRQVIFSFTDLLVSIGGNAGLFLGFSVLGAAEIFYFFSLRLLWYIRGFH